MTLLSGKVVYRDLLLLFAYDLLATLHLHTIATVANLHSLLQKNML